MEINWFTVIAQIVNFLILVWLLKRFLYKPVLDAIDAREKKIASQLSEAAAKKAEAEEEHLLFQKKNEDFDRQRAAKMDAVVEETAAEKQRLLEEVRKDSHVLRATYEADLRQQEQDMMELLKRRTREEVFAITEKTLHDLAGSSLEELTVQRFLQKIEEAEPKEKDQLRHALQHTKSILVTSAYPLSDPSKNALKDAVEHVGGKVDHWTFQQEPDVVSGIKIAAGNHQVSWNIDAYLNSLKSLYTNTEQHAASGSE